MDVVHILALLETFVERFWTVSVLRPSFQGHASVMYLERKKHIREDTPWFFSPLVENSYTV